MVGRFYTNTNRYTRVLFGVKKNGLLNFVQPISYLAIYFISTPSYASLQ